MKVPRKITRSLDRELRYTVRIPVRVGRGEIESALIIHLKRGGEAPKTRTMAWNIVIGVIRNSGITEVLASAGDEAEDEHFELAETLTYKFFPEFYNKETV